MKPIYVLGTGLSHDGSACLLKDGRVCVAIEKERVTRIKHDGGNDTAAIQYVLDAEGIRFSDLALVVQNSYTSMLKFADHWWEGPRLLRDEVPVATISHHLAHAYSALALCPFEESAVLVIDGCGNAFDDCVDLDGAAIPEMPQGDTAHLWHEKDSYYLARGAAITPLFKDFSPWGTGIREYPMHPPTTRHSIGGLYAAASRYVFRGLEDPGKLMGLAPYGRPGMFDFEAFELKEGRAFVRYDWMENFRTPARSHEEFKERFQDYADIAWHIQREVERAILYIVRARHAAHPHRNLCYAGGVALNAVANRRLLAEGPFERVFIQPAAGDNGIALGCAFYGWSQILKQSRQPHQGSVYFGRNYAANSIQPKLRQYAELLGASACADPAAEAASHLADGKIVGWFQGGSEFGPRALGNRSILADARIADIRDRINSKVKFREDFRPFAPSVLAEDYSVFFDGTTESPHMLLTAEVKPQWREVIPGVIHKDHSARTHTVTRDSNPLFYELLRRFKEKTGIGVLLNTSFNRRGMPIVETPEDAIVMFLYSAIDVLILGNHVVRKPADFEARMAKFNAMVAQHSAQRTFQKALNT
ncbi:MAG TPA: carbamoyltransferase C-terminal domain-containing protein [Rhizomicrobium sp.]|nr:carbamoyltransferase C-terminal domain-containing protein [Rhizomicrobium sp.]